MTEVVTQLFVGVTSCKTKIVRQDDNHHAFIISMDDALFEHVNALIENGNPVSFTIYNIDEEEAPQ